MPIGYTQTVDRLTLRSLRSRRLEGRGAIDLGFTEIAALMRKSGKPDLRASSFETAAKAASSG
jgi:hypothetical protein